jgi:hypothetical protein
VRPNSTIGNAALGMISSMLPNAACALCGTTERQIQIGVTRSRSERQTCSPVMGTPGASPGVRVYGAT